MDELTHFNDQGRARMVDVSAKDVTTRVAVARGEIQMKPETLQMVKENVMKKGDVLAVAQVGGVMGAKKTAEIVPMCHPLSLSGIDVSFNVNESESKIEIEAAVKNSGQTGVEMEALTAISVAALTIYDMCKAVEKDMVISDICLLKKSGGKSGEYVRGVKSVITAAVLTISDKGSRGEREDLSGPCAKGILEEISWEVKVLEIVPDEKEIIERKLIEYADELGVDVVFTSGGTGFSTRDVTPEATLAVVERLTPGIPEIMRMESMKITPRAMLSRAQAGIRRKTIIINLPGSPKGVRECLGIILPSLGHGVEILNGQTGECGSL